MTAPTSRLHLATGLLAAGAFAPPAQAALDGNEPIALAIAHDYALPGDGPRPYLLAPTRARFDAAGALRGFNENGPVSWPDAQAVGHTGNDGVIAWGRWGHGRIEGAGKHGNYDITGGEGVRNALYYVAGIPANAAPGPDPAVYEILGGSVAPTTGEGAMAAVTYLDQGKLTVGPDGAELVIRISVPSGEYTLTANRLEVSGATFRSTDNSRINIDGVFCFAGCTARIEGFLAGPRTERAGFAYYIDVVALAEDVAGVVAWKRAD